MPREGRGHRRTWPMHMDGLAVGSSASGRARVWRQRRQCPDQRLQWRRRSADGAGAQSDPSYSVGQSMDLKRILKNADGTNSEAIPRQQSAEAIVSNIISSHFSKKMALEHLMLHYVQGRVLLQVQVSMSPEILIRDAMEVAKQAEEETLRADASISQVSLQLRLGQQIKQLQLASSKNVVDLHADH